MVKYEQKGYVPSWSQSSELLSQRSALFTNPESAKELLASTEKVMQNQSAIMAEVYEYGTGDFDIQRKDIGLYQPSAVDVDITPDTDDIPSVHVPTPAQLVSESNQLVKTTEEQYETAEKSLDILETETMTLKELQRIGALTDMQREYLARSPKMRDDYVQEMRDLNAVISQAKAELAKTRGFEAGVKLSKIMETKRKATSGSYSPY